MMATPPEGTTAIWDAVALTASEVLAQSVGQRSRAIILLTDGYDTTSRLSRKEAINRALAAETVVYAIGIGDREAEGVNHDGLKAVAAATGGRAFFPKRETDLKTAFAEIEAEMRSQYLIAYSSSNKKRDGAYREMRLEVVSAELKKEKLNLRYRPGYFAKPLGAPDRVR